VTEARPSNARRIRARVLSLVSIGMLGPLAVMAWAGWQSFGELQRRVLSERELLARLSAERVEEVLSVQMKSLQEVASAPSFSLGDEDLGPEKAALRHLYVRRHLAFEQVFLIDGKGKLLVQEPSAVRPLDPARLLAQAIARGHSGFTDLVVDSTGARRLYALVLLHGRPGELLGVVGAAIDPAAPQLGTLLRRTQLGEGESIDLVDGRGTVVASTDRTRLFLESDHSNFMAGLIREKRPASGDCHGCHQGNLSRMPEVIAFWPLSSVRWGVSVRQPEGAAYAFAGTLWRNVLALGVLLFAVAILFASGAALSVTRPLATLTEAAERFAAGELERPIPPLPADEVGRLGASLERMRGALKDSLDRVEQANQALEARVKERTGELERLNLALREREEERRAALRKVISAQEDERKRIARELHDETSQALAALEIGLQTAAQTMQDPEGRRRLEEASALAVRTLDEVHRLIIDLRPAVLDDLGLKSAVLWYAERSLKAQGVSVRCEFTALEGRLPPEVETTLFRCAQEAFTNIGRHAEAETVLVQCFRRNGEVVLEIEDDGRGFDVPALSARQAAGGAFGLLGIRERIELLGGTMRLESAPSQGTHLWLCVPLPAEAPHG